MHRRQTLHGTHKTPSSTTLPSSFNEINKNKLSSSRPNKSNNEKVRRGTISVYILPCVAILLSMFLILVAFVSSGTIQFEKNPAKFNHPDTSFTDKQQHQPQQATTRRKRTTEEANAAMLAQPSYNVDGEKYLKKELKSLLVQQSRGENIHAEIVTRWLGHGIDYWKDVNIDRHEQEEWKKEIESRIEKERKHEVGDGWKTPYDYSIIVGSDVIEEDEDDGQDDDENDDEEEGDDVHLAFDKDEIKESEEDDNEEMNDDDNVDDDTEEEQVEGDEMEDDDNIGDEENTDFLNKEQSLQEKDRTLGSNTSSIKSTFPPPLDKAGDNARVILIPTFGVHNPNANAIFAFAEGYDLKTYLGFIASLKRTQFKGDLVLSVSKLESLRPGVEEYLRSKADKEGINIVVYTVSWICYDSSLNVVEGTNGGIRKCNLSNMYGIQASHADDPSLVSSKTTSNTVYKDARTPRPVATARYELYWAWSLQYNPEQWIMLIDSRDTIFQTNPFANLDRFTTVGADPSNNSHTFKSQLHLFAENYEVTNLGESSYNREWLLKAYGKENVDSFMNQPIICSGSTMGHTSAIESYLRAMVAQFDTTHCIMKGCDQGFHNYLYYSNTLQHLSNIDEVIVYEQGKGVINNLAALRTKSLREWGILVDVLDADDLDSGMELKHLRIMNWDNMTVSPVVHQFDRDEELSRFVKKQKEFYNMEWTAYNKINLASLSST